MKTIAIDQLPGGQTKEEVFWEIDNLNVTLNKKTEVIKFEILTWNDNVPEQDGWEARVVTKKEAKKLCHGEWYNTLYYEKGPKLMTVKL